MNRESIISKTKNRILMDLKYLEKQILESKHINMSISVCNILDAISFFHESYLQSLKNCAYSLFLSNLQKSDNNLTKYIDTISIDPKIKQFITYDTPWESYDPSSAALDSVLFLNNSISIKTSDSCMPAKISTIYFLDYLSCSIDSNTYNNVQNHPTYENIEKWFDNDMKSKNIKYEVVSHFNEFYSNRTESYARNQPNITIQSLKLSNVSKRNVKTILPIGSNYNQVITKILNKQKKRIYNLLKIFDKATVPMECSNLYISKLEMCLVKCFIEEWIGDYNTEYSSDLESHKDRLHEDRECYCDEDEVDFCECDPLDCAYVDSFLHTKYVNTLHDNNNFFQLI